MNAFTIHTPKTAPEKSRDIMKVIEGKWGFVPNVVGEMAESPALLRGFSELSAAASQGLFSPIELQVIQMTASRLNDCGYCVAAHSAWSEKVDLPRDVIKDLREEKPLKDGKMEALRQFTMVTMKKLGRAEERDLEAFFKAGYTKAHALEVVLSITLKTMSNYINHIAKTPLDKTFEAHRFESRRDKKSDAKTNVA